jgi:hypothetical protein
MTLMVMMMQHSWRNELESGLRRLNEFEEASEFDRGGFATAPGAVYAENSV